jgi:hypothetical protein
MCAADAAQHNFMLLRLHNTTPSCCVVLLLLLLLRDSVPAVTRC